VTASATAAGGAGRSRYGTRRGNANPLQSQVCVSVARSVSQARFAGRRAVSAFGVSAFVVFFVIFVATRLLTLSCLSWSPATSLLQSRWC